MLRISLLGPLAVALDDAPIVVAGDRVRSVLAVLALQGGRPISPDLLIERCWGEEPLGDPRASLHAAIRRLRVLLGESAITTSEHGYALDVRADVDAVRFRRLLGRIASADRDRLDAALALWRGEPFDATSCDWLCTVERTQLVQLWLAAVERRADLDLADGQAVQVCTELHELAVAYPLRESLWARWLTALGSCGRRAEALEHYAAIRSQIVDELGAEPGNELRAVFEWLLTDPDEVAPRPAISLPQQLPTDIAHFRGRADLLRSLDRLTTRRVDGATRIVVLHGLGGSGKTSLAVHWAHRSGDRFPDGRLFIDLHGYGPTEPVDPAVALERLLRGLGVTDDAVPADPDARSALLRSTLAAREVLLVLDNARDEQQVRPLLPGAGAAVIVTSRGRLSGLAAREGAEQISVDVLSPAEAIDVLDARISADPAALDALAGCCGRLPLALRIAAEQVASHPGATVRDAIKELTDSDDRLEALSAHDPATDLRTVLSWSYAALDPATARFFRLLGVNTAPTLTLPAVAALTGADPATTRRTLRRLLELNLLTGIAPGRYQMHDLLRPYAAERCDAEDGLPARRAAEQRLFDWYVQTLRLARQRLGRRLPVDPMPDVTPLEFPDVTAASSWCAVERDALLAMVRLAAQRARHAEAAQLAVDLWEQLFRSGAVDQSLATQRLAVESARLAGLPDVEATAINQLGTTYGLINDTEKAEARFTEALALFEALGDARSESMVHGNLSYMHSTLGDRGKQEYHARQAVAGARRAKSQPMLVEALNKLAILYLEAGRIDDALRTAKEAVAKIDGPLLNRRRADVVDTLGRALAAHGEYGAAIEQHKKALRTYADVNDRSAWLNGMFHLGCALRDDGKPDEARTVWQQVIEQIDHAVVALLEFDPDQLRRDVAALPSA